MGSDIHGIFQKRTESGWEDVPSEFNEDRHYLLFAWLGNVRNGFGFAGIPIFTPITPLSDNRGLPEDFKVDEGAHHPLAALELMPEWQRKYREAGEPLEIWMGDHSHSWLSADEVLNAEPPKIRREGVVTLEQFKAWDGVSAPDEWSGGVSGPKVLVSEPDSVTDATSHVHITWAEDTAITLKYFIDEVRRLKELHGDVRYVFGFDS